jgi:hypothetical protein
MCHGTALSAVGRVLTKLHRVWVGRTPQVVWQNPDYGNHEQVCISLARSALQGQGQCTSEPFVSLACTAAVHVNRLQQTANPISSRTIPPPAHGVLTAANIDQLHVQPTPTSCRWRTCASLASPWLTSHHTPTLAKLETPRTMCMWHTTPKLRDTHCESCVIRQGSFKRCSVNARTSTS